MKELEKFRTAHKHLINNLNYSFEEFLRFIKTDIELELLEKVSDKDIENWYNELKSENDKKNPFIVRINVKDKDGKWRKISISPVVFSIAAELGARQKMPVTAQQLIQNLAEKYTPSDAKKTGFSRLIQEDLILNIVDLLGGEELKNKILERVEKAKSNFNS